MAGMRTHELNIHILSDCRISARMDTEALKHLTSLPVTIMGAQIYLLLLFLRVLLSWFPAFNWERQPWLALRQVLTSLPYCTLEDLRCVPLGILYQV